MPLQHGDGGAQARRGTLADGTENHALGTKEERQRVVGGASGLTRAVPTDQDGPANVGRSVRRHRQYRDARGRHELIEHVRHVAALGAGPTREHEICSLRGLGQEVVPVALGFLPEDLGRFAAEFSENGLDPVSDLLIGGALRLDEVGSNVGRSFAVSDGDVWRQHHVHADQHGVETLGEAARDLQARLERAVISKIEQDGTVGHGATLSASCFGTISHFSDIERIAPDQSGSNDRGAVPAAPDGRARKRALACLPPGGSTG